MRYASIAASGAVMAGFLVGAGPATALDASDIQHPQVAHVGSRIEVQIDAYQRSCSVRAVGPATGQPVVLKSSGSLAKGRVTVPRKPGRYRLVANCGKGYRATSAPFLAIPASHSLKATCSVVEKGFSVSNDSDHEATWGAVLRNDSAELSATGVEAALTFKDAAGSVVATHQVMGNAIPPGQSMLLTELYLSWPETPGAVSLEIATLCDTSIDAVEPQLLVTGGLSGDSFYSKASGQVANTTTYTLSTMSMANVIVRNAGGAIVGGGYGSIDAFVLPGGTGTWDLNFWNYDFGPNPSVQASVSAVDKATE